MASEKPAPKRLLHAIRFFSDPDQCVKTAIALRCAGGRCLVRLADPPTCISAQHAAFRGAGQQHSRRQFNATIGTVMEDSPILVDKWMVAISNVVGRRLTYKTLIGKNFVESRTN